MIGITPDELKTLDEAVRRDADAQSDNDPVAESLSDDHDRRLRQQTAQRAFLDAAREIVPKLIRAYQKQQQRPEEPWREAIEAWIAAERAIPSISHSGYGAAQDFFYQRCAELRALLKEPKIAAAAPASPLATKLRHLIAHLDREADAHARDLARESSGRERMTRGHIQTLVDTLAVLEAAPGVDPILARKMLAALRCADWLLENLQPGIVGPNIALIRSTLADAEAAFGEVSKVDAHA